MIAMEEEAKLSALNEAVSEEEIAAVQWVANTWNECTTSHGFMG